MVERSMDSHYNSKGEITHTLPILQLVHPHHRRRRHYHHHLHCYLTGLGFGESNDGVLKYVMNLDVGFPLLPRRWKALPWPKIQEIHTQHFQVMEQKYIPYEFHPFTLSHAKVNNKTDSLVLNYRIFSNLIRTRF
jgi:hypothetical protein